MIDFSRLSPSWLRPWQPLVLLMLWGSPLACNAQTPPPAARQADYIVAVVNNELVTQVELQQRILRAREELGRSGQRLPSEAALRQLALNSLIDERVQITYARETGLRVDDAEVDRAAAGIAAANKMTLDTLRERLRSEGMDYARFRANLRDQMMAERVREREVRARIRVTEGEIEDFLAQRRAAQPTTVLMNIAHLLVAVPENASPAVLDQRRARAEWALSRLQAGEPFEAVVRELSDGGNREQGGQLGEKPADRLPDLFVEAVKPLAVGGFTPTLLRSGAGFHLLKLVSRSDPDAPTVTQTRARHILLRTSARLSAEAAQRRLREFRQQALSGKTPFEELARQYSEDGSAPNGGDLGWASPGGFVPEFEEAMNALALGGVSEPVVSRFGVHLIQVVERRQVPQDPKQAREQARNTLREGKFESTYTEWMDELRARAYIEMREPPL